jgi:hypothetical protein
MRRRAFQRLAPNTVKRATTATATTTSSSELTSETTGTGEESNPALAYDLREKDARALRRRFLFHEA